MARRPQDLGLTVVIVVGGRLVLARVAVGGVAHYHRGLADGAVPDKHTLDALGRRRLTAHGRAARRTGARLNQHRSPARQTAAAAAEGWAEGTVWSDSHP